MLLRALRKRVLEGYRGGGNRCNSNSAISLLRLRRDMYRQDCEETRETRCEEEIKEAKVERHRYRHCRDEHGVNDRLRA